MISIFWSMTFVSLGLELRSSLIDIRSRSINVISHYDARRRRRKRRGKLRFLRSDNRLNSLKKRFFLLIMTISMIPSSDQGGWWRWNRRRLTGWTKISKETFDEKIRQRRSTHWRGEIRSSKQMTILSLQSSEKTNSTVDEDEETDDADCSWTTDLSSPLDDTLPPRKQD